MIFGRERKNARRADFFYFEVFRIDFADRGLRMRHIRNFPRGFFELCFRFRQCFFSFGDSVFEFFSFFDELPALCLFKLSFHQGGVFIALFPELLQSRDEGGALVVETYDFIGVGRHIAVYDILFYRFEIVFDKFIIEHILFLY